MDEGISNTFLNLWFKNFIWIQKMSFAGLTKYFIARSHFWWNRFYWGISLDARALLACVHRCVCGADFLTNDLRWKIESLVRMFEKILSVDLTLLRSYPLPTSFYPFWRYFLRKIGEEINLVVCYTFCAVDL